MDFKFARFFTFLIMKISLIDLSSELNINSVWLLNHRYSFSSTSINLRGMNIQSIEDQTFDKYISLTNLDLQDNKLRILPEDLLNKTKKLEVLSLSSNLLQSLPDNIFLHTIHLNRIYLSDNLLEFIQPHLFSKLYQLKKLTLHNNRLQFLPANLFEGLNNEFLFSLSNNFIDLNCSEKIYQHVMDCCDKNPVCQSNKSEMPCLTNSIPSSVQLNRKNKEISLQALTELSFYCPFGYIKSVENSTIVCIEGKWNYTNPLCSLKTTEAVPTDKYKTNDVLANSTVPISSSADRSPKFDGSTNLILIIACVGSLVILSATMIVVAVILYHRPKTVVVSAPNSVPEKYKKLSNASFVLSPVTQSTEGDANFYSGEPEGPSVYDYAPVFRDHDTSDPRFISSGIYEEVIDYDDAN